MTFYIKTSCVAGSKRIAYHGLIGPILKRVKDSLLALQEDPVSILFSAPLWYNLK